MRSPSSSRPAVILLTLAVVGVAAALLIVDRPAPPKEVAAAGSEAQAQQTPGQLSSGQRPVLTSASARVTSDPHINTRELIAGLTNLDLTSGRLSPQQAAQVKRDLGALAAQGPSALATIRAL